MEYKDYYKIMGVARDATNDDIRRAYRKLARKYHPDVSKEASAEERFKAVGEAYEVLKDPEKRAAYDQLGGDWKAGQDFRPPPNWDAGFEFSGGGYTAGGADTFSDFFEELFGRGHARPLGDQSRDSDVDDVGDLHVGSYRDSPVTAMRRSVSRRESTAAWSPKAPALRFSATSSWSSSTPLPSGRVPRGPTSRR